MKSWQESDLIGAVHHAQGRFVSGRQLPEGVAAPEQAAYDDPDMADIAAFSDGSVIFVCSSIRSDRGIAIEPEFWIYR